MSERLLGDGKVIMRSVGAAIASAAFTALTLFAWFNFVLWLIRGSAFTDLPGQKTPELVSRMEPVVMALVALMAGRLAGVFSPALRWPAALLGVLPLLVLFSVSGRPFNLWFAYVIAIALALIGAYAPTWLRRGILGAGSRPA